MLLKQAVIVHTICRIDIRKDSKAITPTRIGMLYFAKNTSTVQVKSKETTDKHRRQADTQRKEY